MGCFLEVEVLGGERFVVRTVEVSELEGSGALSEVLKEALSSGVEVRFATSSSWKTVPEPSSDDELGRALLSLAATEPQQSFSAKELDEVLRRDHGWNKRLHMPVSALVRYLSGRCGVVPWLRRVGYGRATRYLVGPAASTGVTPVKAPARPAAAK